jgi:hypothetical protein
MFGYKFIPEPMNLNDLSAAVELSPTSSKAVHQILVIDDKDVPQVTILRDRGYNLKHVSDIEDFNFLENYDLIMCDIRGIGSRFASDLEGAYVAKKTKEIFPYKKVVLFTGDQYEDKYNDAMRQCDGYLVKDARTDDWEDEIDRLLTESRDPVKQWKIVRVRLLETDVPLLTVYHLEQDYIRAIKTKSPELFPREKSLSGLDKLAQQMISGIAKSLVFKCLGVK